MNTFAVVSKTKKRIHADECGGKREAKFAKGHFVCVDCGNDVFVRRGQKRVWHFAHFREDDARECPHANGGETLEHYEAKHFIARNIDKCAFATERCNVCRRFKFFVSKCEGHALFTQQCAVEVEKVIPGTKRVADVAVMHPKTGRVVAAIEVLHTHEVDANKWKECVSVSVPILEVSTGEVQRVQGTLASSSDQKLLQMVTTHMKFIDCDDCSLARAWMQESEVEISFDKWYTQTWERHESAGDGCANVPRRKACTGEDMLYDMEQGYLYEVHIAELYESWYVSAWQGYIKRLDVLKEYNGIADERKKYILQGQTGASAKIQKYATRNKVFRGRFCVGKCKGCDKWVFEDNGNDVEEVESQTMSKHGWKKLFACDPVKYRKKYMRSDGEFNLIYVHSQCAMECPSCKDMCLVQNLAKFGMCHPCNTYYNDRMERLERSL